MNSILSTETQELLIRDKLEFVRILQKTIAINLRLMERFRENSEIVKVLREEIDFYEDYIKIVVESINFNREIVNEVRKNNIREKSDKNRVFTRDAN